MAFPAASLALIYERTGTPATHTNVATGIQTPVHVTFSAGGGEALLGDLVQGNAPSLELPRASVPDGVIRLNDRFDLPDASWLAREPGIPIRDGTELRVQLKKAPA